MVQMVAESPRSRAAWIPQAFDRLGRTEKSVAGLMAGALVLIFFMLGAADLRSIEGRWAAICSEMIQRGDYLHPYLFGEAYYDKPLLSYWLVVGFARLIGDLDEWALRLPSALAALLAVFSTYRLGRRLFGPRAGVCAGWMLVTSFFFVDWSRSSSADMLNVGGSMLALAWYFDRRERPGFVTTAVFLLILALTSLTKGLIGAVLPMLLLLPDLVRAGRWRQHLRLSLLAAMVPALLVYVAPFLASGLSAEQYGESGLAMVWRENVVRYLAPFDHRDPIYIYAIYLPLYLIPWSAFLIPAIVDVVRRFRRASDGEQWLAMACGLAFFFLTASGSRRSYYVLPLLPPFALLIANWFVERNERIRAAGRWLGFASAAVIFAWFGLAQPLLARQSELVEFGAAVRRVAGEHRPWSDWHVLLVDARPKSAFYLDADHPAARVSLEDFLKRTDQVTAGIAPTIIVASHRNAATMRSLLPDYRVVEQRPTLTARYLGREDPDACIAFVPAALSEQSVSEH
jgi:4-amino-4-deoxy-L-arabinose transferase-like glycosyltransferase